MRVVASVPQPRAHGGAEGLRRQQMPASLGLPPAYEGRDDTHVAESIEPKRGDNAQRCGHDAAERRPHGTAHVDADAVRRDGRGHLRFWHELRYDRLPGGSRDGRRDRYEERKYQQAHWRYEMKPNQGG